MADGAVGLGLDECRTLAAARPLGRLFHHRPDGDHVVAIDRHAGNAIGRRTTGDLWIQGDGAERGCGGIQVVFAHQDHRGALDPGEVQRLVEGTMAGGAVAEERHGHAIGAHVPCRDGRTHGLRRARRHNAIGAEQADRALVQMHGAAAAAAAAAGLAIQLGHQDIGLHALGQRMPVTAMGRGDPICFAQMRADADGSGLLADIQMQEAWRLAAAAGDLGRQLEFAQQRHLFIQPHHLLGGQPLGQRRTVEPSSGF